MLRRRLNCSDDPVPNISPQTPTEQTRPEDREKGMISSEENNMSSITKEKRHIYNKEEMLLERGWS